MRSSRPLTPHRPRPQLPWNREDIGEVVAADVASKEAASPKRPPGSPSSRPDRFEPPAPTAVSVTSPRPSVDEGPVLVAIRELLSRPTLFDACLKMVEAPPGRPPALQIDEGEITAVAERNEGSYAVTFRAPGPRTLEIIHDRPFPGPTQPVIRQAENGFRVVERWNVPYAGKLDDGTLVEARYPRRLNLYSRRIFGKALSADDYRRLVGARPGAYLRLSARHEPADTLEVRVVSEGQTWLFSHDPQGSGPRVELMGWRRRQLNHPGTEARALARALPALDEWGVRKIVTRVGLQSDEELGDGDWQRIGFRQSASAPRAESWSHEGGIRELSFSLVPGSPTRLRLERIGRTHPEPPLRSQSAPTAPDGGVPTAGAGTSVGIKDDPRYGAGAPVPEPFFEDAGLTQGLQQIHAFLSRSVSPAAYARLAEGDAAARTEVWAAQDRLTIAVGEREPTHVAMVRPSGEYGLVIDRNVPALPNEPRTSLDASRPALARNRKVYGLDLDERWYTPATEPLDDGTWVRVAHPQLARTCAEGIFGRPMGAEDYRKLLAVPPGGRIRVVASSKEFPILTVDVRHPFFRAQQHEFYWNPFIDGPEAHTSIWVRREHAPSGVGAQVFADSVDAYDEYGIKLITLDAAQGSGYVGAVVWPKLGFNAPLDEQLREKLPPHLRDSETVLELLQRPGGEEAWGQVAQTMPMVFAVDPESLSRQTLRSYMERRRPVAFTDGASDGLPDDSEAA